MRLATAAKIADPTDAVVAELLASRDLGAADHEFLAWTEGMLTAAVIGPERTGPRTWVELLFGQRYVFESLAQAQACMSALALMHNTILTEIKRKGSDYNPRFLEFAEDGEEIGLATVWATGFLAGMRLHWKAWRDLIESEEGKLSLAPIVVLMMQADGKTPIVNQPADRVAEIHKEALRWLGSAVFRIDEYWRAVAKRSARVSVDAFRKIGRNDPCPCGSKRKSKKCCLG